MRVKNLVTLSPELRDEQSVFRKITVRLIPLLFGCYLVSYIDRVNVGFAKLQMMDDLGMSATAFGFAAGIFFAGYVAFEIPSNLLLLRIGAKKTLARIMLLWGIASTATAFVTSEFSFFVVRFLLGAFEAGFAPGVLLFLTFWYPKALRARMMSYILMGTAVAGIITGPVSGLILTHMNGVAGLDGWRWMFIIEAIPAVILGVVVLIWLADGPDSAKWLNPVELAVVQRAHARDTDAAPQPKEHSFIGALKQYRVWMLALIYFTISAAGYVLSFWLPTIVSGLGDFSLVQTGLLTAIPFGAAAILMPVFARSSDRRQERGWHIAIIGAVGVSGILIAINTANPTVALAFFTVGTVGILGTLPIFWALPSEWLTGSAAAGGIAFVNSVGATGGFVAPYLMGYLEDRTGSSTTGLYVVSISMAVGLVVVVVLTRLNVTTRQRVAVS